MDFSSLFLKLGPDWIGFQSLANERDRVNTTVEVGRALRKHLV